MTWLATLAAKVLEWGLTKVLALIGKDIASWMADNKKNKALQNNQTALQNAEKSKDPTAIQQAGQNSLNNSGGN